MKLAEIRKVIIDAGHGGQEPGAVYNGRREKDDTLQLALDLGNALERRGIQVVYTRVSDVYQSPYEKAVMGNHSDADFFVSIHRNAMPTPGTASGIESLVYANSGAAGMLGRNIDRELAGVGWTDLGVKERPGLVVLKNTTMPAVLVEAGFIDNERDNAFFDANLAATADAIADGILRTYEELASQTAKNGEEPGFYMVQTGIYRQRPNAEAELAELKSLGFPAFLVAKDGMFYVRAGAFRELENAVRMERRLRELGFGTVIVRS
ncbi:MAG: N-acetylmuramoyl-L-alanine amidase [Lachnospiraceae bacterium]|jgi:N-acetylmuramoyl-L-alanine amidase|nr:N-acetylmuramoyl-L-alanine amidase [Lachnospiraceae bacterium]